MSVCFLAGSNEQAGLSWCSKLEKTKSMEGHKDENNQGKAFGYGLFVK